MKPFDLEAAKRGKPIVTRDGRKAFFIAHDPALHPSSCVIARIEGYERARDFDESGVDTPSRETPYDLFMVTTRRTVWVNFWKDGFLKCTPFDSEEEAKNAPGMYPWLHKAIPVEIED